MTPSRTARDSAFARNILAGGGITACREAPRYVNDRRSLIAGATLYIAIAIVVAIAVVIAAAAP